MVGGPRRRDTNQVRVRQGQRWGKKSATAVGIAAGLMVLFRVPFGVDAILTAVIVALTLTTIAWGAGFALGYIMSPPEASLPTPPDE